VSAQTSTEGDQLYGGLTPLHGAFMEIRPGQSDSEKCAESSIIAHLLLAAGANPSTLAQDGTPNGTPVWMRQYCGAEATIALVDYGLNVNLRNPWGETILHHWIRHSTRDVIEKESERFDILDLMLKNDNIDRINKIDALELAGAQLLVTLHPDNRKKAYDYWKKALDLRQREGPNPINKIRLQMTTQSAVEWDTLEDLQTVMQDPYVHWIQGMVTRLRIYSYRSCEAVQGFLQSAFSSNFGDHDGYHAYYNKVEEAPTPTHIEDFLIESLGVFLRLEVPYGPMLWDLTRQLVSELTCSFVTSEDHHPLTDTELVRISTSLHLISRADPDGRIAHKYGFFKMLSCLPDGFVRKEIRKCASPSALQSGGVLLVKACETKSWKTLRVLLHLGADPNTSNYQGILCLHSVAGQKEDPRVLNGEVEREECTPAQLLFNYGANPYAINFEGKTAVELWMEKNCGGEGMQSIAWNYRPHWCRVTAPKLVCLAAKTAHTHGISFSYPRALPDVLLKFLEKN